MRAVVALVVSVLGASPVVPAPNESRTPLKAPAAAAKKPALPPYCSSRYSNSFDALSKKSADFNLKPESQFTYCLRSIATYECLSYAADGTVKKDKRNAVAHGTGFAFRKTGSETLLMSNFHVSEWPAVTDEEHPVEGVPVGCKRVADNLKIVENERDNFENDDIALSKVVMDKALDVSIVKAKGAALNVMPWKIGRSAALKERNVVDVRGFPLGQFKATSLGKVISTYDHDDYKDWDHNDFVVDAALSKGNSGSPVLAVSCETGEYELVGLFHADYSRGNSLNVVVHVDELRELMTTLKRSASGKNDGPGLDAAARKKLGEDAVESEQLFFPFGPFTALARPREDGALIFQVFSKEFPLEPWPAVTLEDLPGSSDSEFGALGRVWFGNARGLREVLRSELDAEVTAQLEKTLMVLRRTAILSVTLRQANAQADISRVAHENADKLEKSLSKLAGGDKDLALSVVELAGREAPKAGFLALPASRPLSP